MKKVFLGIGVLILGGALLAYREEFFRLVMQLEIAGELNPFATAGVLVLLKTLSAPLGFPGTPLTLLSGSLFGHFYGTILSLVGNTLGALLAFLLSRYVFREYVEQNVLARYPRIREYEARLTRNALSTVIVLRLIPLFPFNGLNFLLGVTGISLRDYAIGSFVGMIPGTFLFVYFGESLRMLSLPNILLAVAGILILTFFGKLYEKRSGAL